MVWAWRGHGVPRTKGGGHLGQVALDGFTACYGHPRGASQLVDLRVKAAHVALRKPGTTTCG
eukprot:5082707-Prymnesium_polylepis.1